MMADLRLISGKRSNMLSYSTEFPVSEGSSPDGFLNTVKSWILASPHTKFSPSQFAELAIGKQQSAREGNAFVEIIGAETPEESAVSIRYTVEDGVIEWVTEVSFSGTADPWVSVRTFRDSAGPTAHLPPAKKPVVVMTLLNGLGGGRDGDLEVQRVPRHLNNGEIELAGRIMTGEAGCYLPVVYVSAPFGEATYVDAAALARDLCGMAHVVVEPNRPFSQRLQFEVNSANVYGGAIGIYWPEGAGRYVLLPNSQISLTAQRQVVAREVRAALLNRRPLQWCSWSASQELASRLQLKNLKDSGSGEVELYIKSFDDELKAKNRIIEDAEQEIRRLKGELRAGRQRTVGTGVQLVIIGEQDYFENEIITAVRDAVAEGVSRVQPGGRREHILRAVAASNVGSSIPSDMRERLKVLFRDYRSMTKAVRDGLQDIGFVITDDGKHYKAVYKSDDRYVFAIPKTSSDHRAGLNLASDVAKRLF